MSETLIYTVKAIWPTNMSRLQITYEWSRQVQGQEQRDAVIAFAKEKGAITSWDIYHPPSVTDTMTELAQQFREYPVRPITPQDGIKDEGDG
ncbi:hypothetical protein EVB27_092 [Rhizobium phage RHph_TM16]|nr:hypothetical protein EVB27_092 [Rhizobium phage RHph_TM16]